MLETIKIKADTELGYMIINLSDYDESLHKPYYDTVESPGLTNIETVKTVRKSRSKNTSI